MAFANIFQGRPVLVTGHTGFKGAWLCEWLLSLGAEVTGLALPPDDKSSLFVQLGLASRLHSHHGDIRDAGLVAELVKSCRPEIIFHLAAQPLVRTSYDRPVDTYATNIMGTAHVLEAVRQAGQPCVVVAVTTDKCYENREWVHSYREEDPMGGYDPYSSSKGAAELVISAYRRSYFSHSESTVHVASARAGNVIGGGDWAVDRIVPDCVRALQAGRRVPVRNPRATRPWQHVLEPLSGYLWLAARLFQEGLRSSKSDLPVAALASRQVTPSGLPAAGYPEPPQAPVLPRSLPLISPSGLPAAGYPEPPQAPVLASAFNFGPPLTSNRPVSALLDEALKTWPGTWTDESEPNAVHEATLLNLATDKAFHHLQWEPVWNFSETVAHTMAWYRGAFETPGSETTLTQKQLASYEGQARGKGLAWSQ